MLLIWFGICFVGKRVVNKGWQQQGRIQSPFRKAFLIESIFLSRLLVMQVLFPGVFLPQQFLGLLLLEEPVWQTYCGLPLPKESQPLAPVPLSTPLLSPSTRPILKVLLLSMESSKSWVSTTLRENTWCFSSTLWISHLCVLQKLLLSVTKPMNFMM